MTYAVEQGTVFGGGCCLTGLVWQVCGTASSAGYSPLGFSAPMLRGSGCCCVYLPLVVHNY